MYVTADLLKGYGSILNVLGAPVRPPYLVHQFYRPRANAVEALSGDWNSIARSLSTAAERELQYARTHQVCRAGRPSQS